VFYEEYGLQSDEQHIRYVQHERNHRFTIKTVGGTTSKVDRIRRLLTVFEGARITLPPSRHRTLYDKRSGWHRLRAITSRRRCE
jgi:hypothetical protein